MTIERMFHITLNSEERSTLKRACEILKEIGGEMEDEHINPIDGYQADWTVEDIEFTWGILEDIAEADSLKAEI